MNLFSKFSIVAVALGFALSPLTSQAFTLHSYSWDDPESITYTWGANLDDGPSAIRTAFSQGISDWNSTATRVWFSYNSSYVEGVLDSTCVSDNPAWLGGTNAYVDTYDNTRMTGFHSRINSCGMNVSNATWARSVAGHELGHGLALAETSTTGALMNQSRDRMKIYVPQADDITGVNKKYPY